MAKNKRRSTRINEVRERIETIRAAWSKLAPGETFARMTLAEFVAATQPAINVRIQIEDLDRQWNQLIATRDQEDRKVSELLELVINSVRGTPGFGVDSGLYRDLGYVRKSERGTGNSRKNRNRPSANAS
jgi:hypothetical protein